MRASARGERANEAQLGPRGRRVEASLCKGDGQFGNPGIPVARGCRAPDTSCGIVSARLSASNGRIRASRASKSDGCSALLERISCAERSQRGVVPSGLACWCPSRRAALFASVGAI